MAGTTGQVPAPESSSATYHDPRREPSSGAVPINHDVQQPINNPSAELAEGGELEVMKCPEYIQYSQLGAEELEDKLEDMENSDSEAGIRR